MSRIAPYRAFYDRTNGTIEGVFTILDIHSDIKVFNRLPARSGQRSFTYSSWQRGKSPIPYSSELGNNQLRIHIARPKQENQWAPSGTIGEFWNVYNMPGNVRLIRGVGGGERWDVGIHPENAYPGSAGCVVLVADTHQQRAELIRLSRFMKSLIGVYDYMPFTVL